MPRLQTLRVWYRNARPHALPQSILPSLLAVCFAVHAEGFSLWLALLAVLGVGCGHLAANLFDDYFDYKRCRTDYRDYLKHEGFRARVGKCAYLASGSATLEQLLRAAWAFTMVALLAGTVIFYYRGLPILLIAGATALFSLTYSGPPLRLSYRGLGEVAIGLIFGPLNMLGTYYAACGAVDRAVVLVSVAVGLLVMNIVYVHAMLDYVPDKKIGKQTLAVTLDRSGAMLAVLFLVLFLPYGVIVYGIWRGDLSSGYGALLLTLPMAAVLFRMMLIYTRDPGRPFSPQFWMGPMPDWERFEAIGTGWFMIRWLLARNLLAILCVIAMILTFAA